MYIINKKYNFVDLIKNLLLVCAILLTIKIVYSVGPFFYVKFWIGLFLNCIQKLFNLNDSFFAPFYSYFYSILGGSGYAEIAIRNPSLGLLKPGFDLMLISLAINFWSLYYFYKKNDNKLNLSIDKNDSRSVFLMVLFFLCFGYLIFEIVRCFFVEICPVFIGTLFLYILQFFIIFLTIMTSFLLPAILNNSKLNFFIKIILACMVLVVLFGVPCLMVAGALWDQGYVQGLLDYSIQNNTNILSQQQVYSGIIELYETYGVPLLYCNPEFLNPCGNIKKQIEIACTVPDIFQQLPLGGRGFTSNVAGLLGSFGLDQALGCHDLRAMLVTCMDDYHRQIWLQHYLENQLKAKPLLPFIKPAIVWPMSPKPPTF